MDFGFRFHVPMYYSDLLVAEKEDVTARNFRLLVDVAYEERQSLYRDEGESKCFETHSQREEGRHKRYFNPIPTKPRGSMMIPCSRRNPPNLNVACSSSSSSIIDSETLSLIVADLASQYPQNLNSEPSPFSSCIAENTRSRKRGLLEEINPNPTLGITKPPKPNGVGYKKPKGGVPDYSWIGREAPEWLISMMTLMNGSELKLIFERKLFKTDVEPGECRLSMPVNQLICNVNDFLTPVEFGILEADIHEDIKTGFGAILVDQESEKTGVMLKRWESNGSWNYSLTCGWNDFVNDNGLKAGDDISIWSFRWRQVLCFALVRPPNNETE